MCSQTPAILGDNNYLVRADDECIYQVTIPDDIVSWYYYDTGPNGIMQFRTLGGDTIVNGYDWSQWGTAAYGEEGNVIEARFPSGVTGNDVYTSDSNTGNLGRESQADANTDCCTLNEPGVTCLSALSISYISLPKVLTDINIIKINWKVAQEINNEKFIVQHRKDGIHFNNIGEVQGLGSSYEIREYEFIHKNPTQGKNYYRIKQVDFDGKYSFSEVVSVNFEGEEMTIFPNQGKGVIRVNSPDAERLFIYDQYGKIILEGQLEKGENQMDLGQLQQGMYIFKTESGKAMRWVKM